MSRYTPAKTCAQVAVEAIVNEPSGYDVATMKDVLAVATEADVAELYLSMLRDIIGKA